MYTLRVPSLKLFLGLWLATAVTAQSDFTIYEIGVPGNRTIVGGTAFKCTVKTAQSSSYDVSAHRASFELMSGPKGSGNVVDIMALEVGTIGLSATYQFPKSLPQGPYHIRVQISNSTIQPTLSETFNVTKFPPPCRSPPPYANITSSSDPKYRSFHIINPQPGDSISIGKDNAGEILVAWDYRNRHNAVNVGISGLVFEFIKKDNSTGTGQYNVKASDFLDTIIPFKDRGLSVGTWQIRANYTSLFEGNGKQVSYVSEPFFIAGTGGTCDGIGSGARGGWEGIVPTWWMMLFVTGIYLSL